MRKILCLSTSNYDPIPTRKQNVMNRMTDAQVLYVDPPVTLIAPLKDPNTRNRLHAYLEGGAQRRDHLKVYASPPVLPFYNKLRTLNRHNQKKLAAYLKGLLKENDFGTDFYLWCYSPSTADLIAPLAGMLGMDPESLWQRTIYDCVDRHSAYPGMIDPQVVDSMEADLARKAGTVFTTAQGLFDRLSVLNPNTHLIPNGVDYELFSAVAGWAPQTERPLTFGFVGMLQDCIDYDCIRAVSRAFPEGKVVLVGKALPGVDLSWIADYPNVECLGLVPQNQLPGIMLSFHACLNVFARNELSKDVSPLKFYEYLATGKPVVSTPVPLQVKEYADCIYLADDTEEFVHKCREAAGEAPEDPKREERMRRAKSCSWEERLRTMRSILGWIEG
ncbi:MAG TPA: glycosyltransferase family 1 protein [Clostridiales bacterium]|nr:glycosyltransferase family 1 protein [Clostridiales bacterium]